VSNLWTRTTQRLGHSDLVGRVAPRALPPVDRFLSRVSGGRWHVLGNALPTLMMTCTGRRSGQPREQPLAYVDASTGWAVVGTNFGQDHHPAWTHNLLADPDATVQVDGATHAVRARLLEEGSPDRRVLWERFVAMWPAYDTYLRRTERRPRLFVLERQGPAR
jgi:deazaflavin-dependent oxidoreductase (nitroreductase family)